MTEDEITCDECGWPLEWDGDPCGGQGWTEGPPAHHPNCDGQCLGGVCPIQTQVECDWPGHRVGGGRA